MSLKPTILFVDDDANTIAAYRRMLRPFGAMWEISYHTDSRVACDEIRRHPTDVVVTDFEMPYMSGLELLTYLKANPATQNIPVIVATGERDRNLKRRALDAGAADLMNKPIEFEELLARLRGSLRLKACYDELNDRNERLEQRVLERTRELHQSRLEIVARLANAAEYRDEDTGRHVVRVAHFSRVIAEALKLPPDEVLSLFIAAPLHDVGKIAIPDAILKKTGKLTEEERRIMQTHCGIGGRILGNEFSQRIDWRLPVTADQTAIKEILDDPVLKTAREIALTHHERWDGTGYPAGLAGEDIPLAGRIVAMADVFDALTTARCYKPAFTLEHSLKLISESVGSHFDPQVHAAFLSRLPEIEELRSALADESPAETVLIFPSQKQATA